MFETGGTSDLGFWGTWLYLYFGDRTYLPEGNTFTFLCVCLCGVCACACMCMEARGGFQVFLSHSPFHFWDRISYQTWSSSIWLHELASKPRGPLPLPWLHWHCKHLPTRLLFLSGATDQTQVLGLLQWALHWLGHLPGLQILTVTGFMRSGLEFCPCHPCLRSSEFWIKNAHSISQLSNMPSVVTVNIFS